MREGDVGIDRAKGCYRYPLRRYSLMELAQSSQECIV